METLLTFDVVMRCTVCREVAKKLKKTFSDLFLSFIHFISAMTELSTVSRSCFMAKNVFFLLFFPCVFESL